MKFFVETGVTMKFTASEKDVNFIKQEEGGEISFVELPGHGEGVLIELQFEQQKLNQKFHAIVETGKLFGKIYRASMGIENCYHEALLMMYASKGHIYVFFSKIANDKKIRIMEKKQDFYEKSIDVLLLIPPRLDGTSSILLFQIREKFGPTATVDKYIFGTRVILQKSLYQFSATPSTCSVETFLSIGTLYANMSVYKKGVGFYVDLLQRDQLDENMPVTNLEKSVAYFETVYPVSSFMADHAKFLAAGVNYVTIEVKRIKVLMDGKGELSEVGLLLKVVENQIRELELHVKIFKRRLRQEGTAGPIKFPESVASQWTYSEISPSSVLQVNSTFGRSTLVLATSNRVPPVKILHAAIDSVTEFGDQGIQFLTNALATIQAKVAAISTSVPTKMEGSVLLNALVTIQAKVVVISTSVHTKTEWSVPPFVVRVKEVNAEIRDATQLKLYTRIPRKKSYPVMSCKETTNEESNMINLSKSHMLTMKSVPMLDGLAMEIEKEENKFRNYFKIRGCFGDHLGGGRQWVVQKIVLALPSDSPIQMMNTTRLWSTMSSGAFHPKLSNIGQLKLLLSGDVELNPGPGSETGNSAANETDKDLQQVALDADKDLNNIDKVIDDNFIENEALFDEQFPEPVEAKTEGKKKEREQPNYNLKCVGAEVSEDKNVATNYLFTIALKPIEGFEERDKIVYNVEIKMDQIHGAFDIWGRQIKSGCLRSPGSKNNFSEDIYRAILDYEKSQSYTANPGQSKRKLQLDKETWFYDNDEIYFASGEKEIFKLIDEYPYCMKLSEEEINDLEFRVSYHGKTVKFVDNPGDCTAKFFDLIEKYNSLQEEVDQSAFVYTIIQTVKADAYRVVPDHRIGVLASMNTGCGKSAQMAIGDSLATGTETPLGGCTKSGLRRVLEKGEVGRFDEVTIECGKFLLDLQKAIWPRGGGTIPMGNKDVKIHSTIQLATNLTPDEIAKKWNAPHDAITKFDISHIGETPLDDIDSDATNITRECTAMARDLYKYKPWLFFPLVFILKNPVSSLQLVDFEEMMGGRNERYGQGFYHLREVCKMLVEMGVINGIPKSQIPESLKNPSYCNLLSFQSTMGRRGERRLIDVVRDIMKQPKEARKVMFLTKNGPPRLVIKTSELYASVAYQSWMKKLLDAAEKFDSKEGSTRVLGRAVPVNSIRSLMDKLKEILSASVTAVLIEKHASSERRKTQSLTMLKKAIRKFKVQNIQTKKKIAINDETNEEKRNKVGEKVGEKEKGLKRMACTGEKSQNKSTEEKSKNKRSKVSLKVSDVRSQLSVEDLECNDEFENGAMCNLVFESHYEELDLEEAFSLSDGIHSCRKCPKKYKRRKLAEAHAKKFHRIIIKKPVKA